MAYKQKSNWSVLTGNGNGDGDPDGDLPGKSTVKSKSKTKINRKGELVTKTRWKDTETGRKGGSKTVVSPITTTYDTDIIKGYLKSKIKPGSETITPTPGIPKETKGTTTPPTTTKGDTKPYIKPLKGDDKKPVTSYRAAYEKTDKSKPFEQFREDAIQWNIDNPPSSTKGSTTPPTDESNELLKIKLRPGGKIKVDTPPVVMMSINMKQEVDESNWEKGPKQRFKTKRNPPPYNPTKPPAGEYSTTSSTSCGKDGCIGSDGIEGMFSSDFTNKDRRQFNKAQRKITKTGRQDYREAMSNVRKDNRSNKKFRGKYTNTQLHLGTSIKTKLQRTFPKIMQKFN